MSKKYIPAGAGSGKTHTLTHMLANMLVPEGNEEPVKASRIILTTFTKSAAADFVQRARDVLINKKGNPAIASELDSALIGTVHSVCERFVKKYWYRLGLTLPLNTLADEDRALYKSRTSESVAEDGDVEFFNQFARDFEMKSEFWKEYLQRLIDNKYNFGVKELSASKKLSCDDIDKVFARISAPREKKYMEGFLNRVLTLVKSDLISNPDNETGKKRRDDLENLLSGSDIQRAKAIISIINFTDEKVYTKSYWKELENEHWDLTGISSAAENYLISTEVGERWKECVTKLFDLAIKWEEEYRSFKSANRLLDFNDMEQKFLQLLEEDEEVRKDISSSFDVMMVDEFQDSNPVQIQIFRKLMELIKDTVFVGDSKQAIYGFRGTESTLVDDFIKDIKDQKALKESHRSRRELVEAANDIFCFPFTGHSRLPVDPNDDSKPYDGVSLSPVRHEWDALQPALQHWNTPVDGNSAKNNYAAVGNKIFELVNSGLCKVIRKDNEGKEYPDSIHFGDIAILVRNNASIKEAVPALRSAGVPVSIQEKEFICWAEVQLIMSLARYVFDDEDKCAWADILHLVGGMATEDIIRNKATGLQTDEENQLLGKLKDIRSRLSVLSVSEIVESLILELDMYENVKGWGLSATRTRNIGFMVDLAKKYEQKCENLNIAPTLPGYLSYVSEFETETHPVDKTDTVKVLTCHKAKGLDWPMVIMDELDSLKTDDESVFKKGFSGVCNVRVGDEVLLRLFPQWRNAKSAKLPAPFLKCLSDSKMLEPIRKRKVEEERRLLYVAFTRAKDYLVTLGNENSTYSWLKKCTEDVPLSRDGDKLTLWHASHPSLFVDLPSVDKSDSVRDEQITPWVVPVKKAGSEKYVSPSKAGHKGQVETDLVEMFKGKPMDQNIPAGKSDVCGTCIHHIFAAYSPLKDKQEMIEMASRIIEGMDVKDAFPCPESVIESAVQFFDWLRDKYGPGTPFHELPFLLNNDDGTVVRGEMDLVWKLSDQECVLVDYKSYHDKEDFDDPEAFDKYYGYAQQLKYYKDTLESAKIKVRDTLIYYFIQGRVIQFQFK